jgi:hypothetical protein
MNLDVFRRLETKGISHRKSRSANVRCECERKLECAMAALTTLMVANLISQFRLPWKLVSLGANRV